MAVKKLIAASIIAGFANIANAGMITEWGYTNEAGFNSWSSAATPGNDGGTNVDLIPGTFTSLTWGDGILNPALDMGSDGIDNDGDGLIDEADETGTSLINDGVDNAQSSLVIDSPISGGTVVTNNGFVAGTSITHNNWIVGAPYLTDASLLDALLLVPEGLDGVPTDFGGFVVPAPLIEFNIDFYETTNHVDYGWSPYPTATSKIVDTSIKCPNGEMNGSGSNINGCADIFVISTDNPAVNFSVEGTDLLFDVEFNFHSIPGINDYDYKLTTVLSGLQFISSEACLSVGAPATCIGFVTEEEKTNQLSAKYQIVATAPEPSSIAILGLGLLGLVAANRKKVK